LARYLDRYGVVCDSVRVTSRTTPDTTTTWIGLAVSGARNMSALRGRSARIPLRQTAEVAARRLAAQLVETGWTATYVAEDELPVLAAPHAREGWRSVIDDHGHLTTYAVAHPESAAAGVSPSVGQESWTAVEIVGTPTRPQIRAGIAIRTHERPATTAPMRGLLPMPGRQASALAALHPLSGLRLVN
jgi:type VII secretion protein EccE